MPYEPDSPSLALMVQALRREVEQLTKQALEQQGHIQNLHAQLAELAERTAPAQMDRALARLISSQR